MENFTQQQRLNGVGFTIGQPENDSPLKSGKKEFTQSLYTMINGWGKQTKESETIVKNAEQMRYSDFTKWILETYNLHPSEVGRIYDAATDD